MPNEPVQPESWKDTPGAEPIAPESWKDEVVAPEPEAPAEESQQHEGGEV